MPKPKDPYLKQRVLDMRMANKPVDWIAEHLNLPESTIYGWCREARADARVKMWTHIKHLEAIATERNDPALWNLVVLLTRSSRELSV